MEAFDTQSRRKRGRPPKFGRPAKAVTVTLPLDVIDKLRAIHPDLARAIVELVQHRWAEDGPDRVRLREVSPGQYLIVVARGRDMLEVGTVPPYEEAAVRDLIQLLAQYRRQLSITEESLLIVLQDRPA